MATPLRLPAKADIHEFSVMFTKSVKKKAKDWHDGFLKWHTFNYRAILYDDQRKPVANEFFPNRTIHADSDLEFSSALVQIGHQLETMQANLEHVYKKSAATAVQTPLSSGIRIAEHVSAQSPRTPAIERSAQKRVYPSNDSIRPQVRGPVQITPSKTIARRKLGITRIPESAKRTPSERHIVYPFVQRRPERDELTSAPERPGWFARQDQSETTPKKAESTAPDKAVRTRKPANAGKENSLASRPKSKSAAPGKQSATKVTKEFCITTSPVPNCAAENRAEVESATVLPLSKLDPTRAEIQPRQRRLLAAAKHRSSSIDARSPAMTPDVLALPSQLSQHSEAESIDSIPLELAQNLECVEAILDIDTQKWIAEENAESGHKEDSSSDLQAMSSFQELVAQPKLGPQYIPQRAVTISNERARAPLGDHEVRVDVLSPDCAATTGTVGGQPKFRPSPIADDDGFLAPVISHRKRRLAVQPNLKRCKTRPASRLVEQFMSDPSVEDDHEDFFRSMAAEETPLFLPDVSPEKQLPTSQKSSQGLFTQIATKAAQHIASHSTLGRLDPAKRRKVQSLPRLHQSIGKLCKPVQVKSASKMPMSNMDNESCTRVNQNPESDGGRTTSVHLNIRDTLSVITRRSQHDTALAEQLFPATPTELQTADLDAVFASAEARQAIVPEPTVTKLPVEPTSRESTSLSHANTDFRLATQINSRAPDFMSAKSFQQGAKLQLDQPIEAVGMSARELAALDMATQLSDAIET